MRQIDFMGSRKKFLLLSLICVIISLITITVNRGLNLGLDFTGGILLQIGIKNKDVDISTLRQILSTDNDIKNVVIQNIVSSSKETKEFLLKLKTVQQQNVREKISTILSNHGIDFEIVRIEYVGPTIGRHLTSKAFYAIVFSLIGIIIYVAIRFGSSIWGIAGVIALIHDVFLTLGFLTILGKEINLTVIAALLTLAGYSINDTIVIFDRIRENIKLLRKEQLDKIINISINQTLTRTLLTSGTTFVAVFTLFIIGNRIIKDFALTLVFGIIVGTYSSIFVASALVLEYVMVTTKKK